MCSISHIGIMKDNDGRPIYFFDDYKDLPITVGLKVDAQKLIKAIREIVAELEKLKEEVGDENKEVDITITKDIGNGTEIIFTKKPKRNPKLMLRSGNMVAYLRHSAFFWSRWIEGSTRFFKDIARTIERIDAKQEGKPYTSFGTLCGKVKDENTLIWLGKIEVHVEKTNLSDYISADVCLTGTITYKDEKPVSILPLKLEVQKKIKPKIDELIGIIKLDKDSVETIREMRSKWD